MPITVPDVPRSYIVKLYESELTNSCISASVCANRKTIIYIQGNAPDVRFEDARRTFWLLETQIGEASSQQMITNQSRIFEPVKTRLQFGHPIPISFFEKKQIDSRHVSPLHLPVWEYIIKVQVTPFLIFLCGITKLQRKSCRIIHVQETVLLNKIFLITTND